MTYRLSCGKREDFAAAAGVETGRRVQSVAVAAAAAVNIFSRIDTAAILQAGLAANATGATTSTRTPSLVASE